MSVATRAEAPIRGTTAPAEHDLVLRARNRPQDRERLIELFMPLIGSIARNYRSAQAVDRAELMQEGVVGLLRSLERYDPERGTPFWAYASWWVRRGMQQLVAELSGPVVLSDRAARQLARVREARHTRLQACRDGGTATQLASDTGLSTTSVDRLIATERLTRSLEESGAAEDGRPLRDTVVDPTAELAYERATDGVVAEQLLAMLDDLSDRERAVVCARFGLHGRELTLRELGDVMGISAERVRQVEQEALDKLRQRIGVAC